MRKVNKKQYSLLEKTLILLLLERKINIILLYYKCGQKKKILDTAMCMKENGCCPKSKRGDNSTYTFTKRGGGHVPCKRNSY